MPSRRPRAIAESVRALAPDTPFAPRRLPFFYGWVVVAVSTLGVLFSIPGQTMGVSVFTDPLLAATGLDRLTFSSAYLLGTLGSAALLPRAGVAVDRLGVRRTAIGAAAALAAVVALLSRADQLGQAVSSAFGLTSTVGAFVVLTGLFVCLRFFGQGVLTLVSRTMLARWFDRRRGLATALSGVFVSFGFALAPLLLKAWIGAAGWRGAWLGLSAAIAFGMGPIAYLFFREDPESCGLRLDGERPKPAGAEATGGDEASARQASPAVTRTEALRTRAFWVPTFALALHAMVVTGITLHVVDVGAEAGLSPEGTVALFLPEAVVSTVTGALIGWLADRVSIRRLLLVMASAQVLGFAASAHLGHPAGFALAAVGLGAAGGCFSVLTTVANPRFFGRAHLGAINAATMTALVVGSALGPSLLAASRILLGSYQPGLHGAALLPLALLATLVSAPLHPRDTATPSQR